jgi:hypothetical protein
MIFRSLDSNGDWVFGNGRQAYAKLNQAIILNIETNIKTFFGECFFNPNIGQPWFDLINIRDKDAIVLIIKGAIAELYGVLGVNEIEYTYTLDRDFEIKYDIKTLYADKLRGTINI